MRADDHTSLAHVRDVAAPAREPYVLDAIDLALLKMLVADSRTSQRQLAAALGVSAPTVGERMARLERNGIITGYSVVIDWDLVGFGQVVLLSIEAASGYDVSTIMTALWQIAEVESVTLVTGELDLLIRLRVRDYNHLRAILMDQIWQIPGTQRTSTLLSVAEMPMKDFATGLLDKLGGQGST